MEDNPVFGVLLFAIGFAVIVIAYFTRTPLTHLIVGYILVGNGTLFLILGLRKRSVNSGGLRFFGRRSLRPSRIVRR